MDTVHFFKFYRKDSNWCCMFKRHRVQIIIGISRPEDFVAFLSSSNQITKGALKYIKIISHCSDLLFIFILTFVMASALNKKRKYQ